MGRWVTAIPTLIGSAATKTLKRYHADRAFLGTSGITLAHGYSTANPMEAQVKQAMIRSADETYILGGFVQIRAGLPAKLCKPFGYFLDADGLQECPGNFVMRLLNSG